MKKLMVLASAFLAVNFANSAPITEAMVNTGMPLSPEPEVIEFFSFGCPACYEMQYTYKLPSKLKSALPKGVKFKEIPVSLGETKMEAEIAKAWALAQMLKVQDKVREPIYNAVRNAIINHLTNSPSREDLRKIFLNAGVKAEGFNAIDSFAVNAKVQEQTKLIEALKITGTPTFVVNQKYTVNTQKLPRTNVDAFFNSYLDTILALVDKK